MWQIICWFAGIWQKWGIQFTPSAWYTRSSKQTLCVGLEVEQTEAMIRNWYNRILHPALNTKLERTPTMKMAPKQKQHKRKAKGTALSKAKEYSKSKRKQRVGPMTRTSASKMAKRSWAPPLFSHRINTDKLIERSRVCHNHKPQPTLDTKRKRKRTKTYTRKTNKQMYEKHKDKLPLPQARCSECYKKRRKEDKEHEKTLKH